MTFQLSSKIVFHVETRPANIWGCGWHNVGTFQSADAAHAEAKFLAARGDPTIRGGIGGLVEARVLAETTTLELHGETP